MKKEIADLRLQLNNADDRASKGIYSVSKQADKLENRLKVLDERLDEVNQPIWDELDRFGITGAAYLPPQSKGSARVVSTTWGKVAISFHDILPYANGSKVTAKFMNLSGVTFSDCKLRGSGITTTGTDEPMTRRSDDATATLEVGRPKSISFLIPDIPPSKFETLRVSVHDCSAVPIWK